MVSVSGGQWPIPLRKLPQQFNFDENWFCSSSYCDEMITTFLVIQQLHVPIIVVICKCKNRNCTKRIVWQIWIKIWKIINGIGTWVSLCYVLISGEILETSWRYEAVGSKETNGLPPPLDIDGLTYWGRVTHICVSELTIIGSDNGLSPGWHLAIIWTNARILLIGPLGTNLNEILIEIHTFHSRKRIWKYRV